MSKRGRPPTGCPKWNAEKQVWEAHLYNSGTTRKPVAMPGIAEHDVEGARRLAKAVALRAREGGFVPAEAMETVDEWYARYYEAAATGEVGKKNRGRPQVTAKGRSRRFLRWISPEIGTKAMVQVTGDDLRRVVRVLDEKIRERLRFYESMLPGQKHKGRKPGLAPKAAKNIWSECTAGFAEACSSKLDTLRVRTDDPTRVVQGPSAGDDREQAALYPSELLALLSAPDEKVPAYRKILYACAAYLGLRLGELRNLTAASVDLEHDVVNVRKQRSASGKVKRTKTSAGRRQVPIHPHVRPLLEILVEKAGEGEPLLRVPPAEDCAEKVREDLIAAGCDREDLFADDGDRMHFTFHGLRHTCITHWSVKGPGTQLAWLYAAAGHRSFDVTQKYLDRAMMLRSTFGEPHPPLPPSLVAVAERKEYWMNSGKVGANRAKLWRPQRELNCREDRPELSPQRERSAAQQAVCEIGDAPSPTTIQDSSGRGNPESEDEIRDEIARLQEQLAAKQRARIRVVK